MGSLYVEFYENAVENEVETKKQGRPIYDTKDYIRFTFPGGRDVHARPVYPEDKDTYPIQWAQYQAHKEQVGSGTPLEQWPILNTGRVKELKAQHIHTVDQLAELTDAQGPKALGLGWRELRQQARDYIEVAQGSTAPIERERAAREELELQLQEALVQLNELKQIVQSTEKVEARKAK